MVQDWVWLQSLRDIMGKWVPVWGSCVPKDSPSLMLHGISSVAPSHVIRCCSVIITYIMWHGQTIVSDGLKTQHHDGHVTCVSGVCLVCCSAHGPSSLSNQITVTVTLPPPLQWSWRDGDEQHILIPPSPPFNRSSWLVWLPVAWLAPVA